MLAHVLAQPQGRRAHAPLSLSPLFLLSATPSTEATARTLGRPRTLTLVQIRPHMRLKVCAGTSQWL